MALLAQEVRERFVRHGEDLADDSVVLCTLVGGPWPRNRPPLACRSERSARTAARSAGVAEGVDSARSTVDALLTNGCCGALGRRVRRIRIARGVGVGVAAGSQVTLDDVRSGAALDDPVVQGALRVQSAIGTLADTWTRAPRQALAGCTLWRPPTSSTRRCSDVRPAARAARHARRRARRDVRAGGRGRRGRTRRAAVAGPFAPVSGVVAMAAVRLTLVERGLDPSRWSSSRRDIANCIPSTARRSTPTGTGRRPDWPGGWDIVRTPSWRARERQWRSARRSRAAELRPDMDGGAAEAAPPNTIRRVTRRASASCRARPLEGPRRLTFRVVGSPRGARWTVSAEARWGLDRHRRTSSVIVIGRPEPRTAQDLQAV